MRSSIYYKITVIFIAALIFVSALFATFARIQRNNAIQKIENTQLNAIHYLLGMYDLGRPPQDLRQYFRNFNMEILQNKTLVNNILANGELVFTQDTQLGQFISMRYKKSMFLFIQNETFNVGFESMATRNINEPLWLGYFITLGLLISLYYSVLSSLLPIKKLNSHIQKFAGGNLDIMDLEVKGDDEIANLTREFNNAVEKIRELIRSRQLFLRTIMHELKTPIGKGRIVAEMVDDETQQARLVSVFERLDILINEFAKIEQLLSKSYSLNLQECHFSLLLEQTKDILLLDDFDEKVNVKIQDDVVLNVDFQLFTLALKNLVDNALKYAEDKKVFIVCDEKKVTISNRGTPLPISIDHYKQAFIRDKNKKAGGLGLGLYIIDKICALHKFKLDYFHENNMHNFVIKFDGR